MSRRRLIILKTSIVVFVAAALGFVMGAIGPAQALTTPTTWDSAVTCTADSLGYCISNHPGGVVPDAVLITPTAPTMWSVDQVTVTTFRVRFYRTISSTGSVTAIPGNHTFFVHVAWGLPTSPSVSPSASLSPSPSSSVSPSLSPSPTGTPPQTFPDASNTGVPAGVTLTVVNGDQTISGPNSICLVTADSTCTIDAKDINGCVVVDAINVHITRSKIHCNGFEVVQHGDKGVKDVAPAGCGQPPATPCIWVPLAISDSEITCTSGTGGTAVGDTNVTLDRVEVTNCENGFDADQWVTVQNSWIHALLGGVGHTDGLQMAHYLDGCNNSSCEVSHARFVDVIHNTIEAIDGTSAIISNPLGDNDIHILNNLMTGGAYTLYCPYLEGHAGPDAGVNWFAQNNRFIRTASRPNSGAFGPTSDCGDEDPTHVTGNVWDDDSSPVPL
jgi:hypothetical protein